MNGQPTILVRKRVARLRWALPIAIGLAAVFYEIGPGRWIHDAYGAGDYFSLDILFYGTVAPAMAFFVLTYINRWLDDKERAEQQARASTERLASVTAASADAILGLDAAGRIESWNHGAELIFGYPRHPDGGPVDQPAAGRRRSRRGDAALAAGRSAANRFHSRL